MSTEQRARTWLRLDGVYCIVTGALALALAEPLGRLFQTPMELTLGVGVVAILWGLLLTRLSSRLGWRAPLVLVAAANAAASAVLIGLAIVAPRALAQVLLAAVAVEVAAFASVQLRIFHRSA